MKLDAGEHTLLASFPSGPKAEAALGALKAAGYADVQMDRIGAQGFRPDVFEQRPAISGKETSLVQAVLKPGQMDDESRVLLGATTDASGMSGGSNDIDMPFLVTVVCKNEAVDRAVRLIHEHGGRV